MKSKPTKFTNPFDLMDQQAQQIIQMKAPVSKQAVLKGKVHAPLPFDSYQTQQMTQNSANIKTSSTKQIKGSQQVSSYSSIIKQTKKAGIKSKGGFSNPFGNEYQVQEQSLSPMKGPIGFNPQTTIQSPQQTQYNGQLNQDGDPPLLQDIGIDIVSIKERLIMTIKVETPAYQKLQTADLSGPIMIAMLFGCLLLLSGKIHFGDIYAMFLFGNSIMYFLINYMNQSDIIPLYNVMSSLGYSLLPMLILGFFGIFFSLKGTIGILLSLSIAFWSSLSAGNTLEVYLRQPHNDRKVLLVYPLFLFYLCFGMIVIF